MSQDLNGPIFDKIHRDGMGYVWEISDEATVAAAGGKVKRGEGLEYIKGADATELAANMGVDAAALAETIEAYNAAVDSGVDREIGGFPTAKLEAPSWPCPSCRARSSRTAAWLAPSRARSSVLMAK